MSILLDLLLRFRIAAMARADAACGIDNEDVAVTTLFGPEPRAFDPLASDEDRRLQHQRVNTTLRDELAEDRRARETARAAEMSPLVAVPLVLLLFLIEWWASARVLIGQGSEPAAAVVLGAALAAGVFALAGYCARKPTRKSVYLLVVAAFAVLVVALTVLRVHEVATEDSDVPTDLSSGIVLLVLSVGPAFLGEVVLRKATNALRVRRDLTTVQRQLRAKDATISGAEAAIKRRIADREAWLRRSAIARAEYRRVWDVARSGAAPTRRTPAGVSTLTPLLPTAPTLTTRKENEP